MSGGRSKEAISSSISPYWVTRPSELRLELGRGDKLKAQLAIDRSTAAASLLAT
jgi:hypothetical protein